ncbi:endonuclease NucS domain-containing protein [Maioricimonas sp. JC845]|uniref:endonuclease NucS domain-containing protein n=1 Tax=Maioricimonas sp. JC845 TaxID=3232138 RepID=UPI003459B378
MPRYWVIAPGDSRDSDLSDAIWQYDLDNSIISIGWAAVGDISAANVDEIRQRLLRTWPDMAPASATYAARSLYRFYNEINPGDIVVARWGLKWIAGVGTVTGSPTYDPDRLRGIFGQFGDDYAKIAYPNHIGVEWNDSPRDLDLERRVFGMQTLYEIDEDKYHSLFEASGAGDTSIDTDSNGGEIARAETEFVLEHYLEDFLVNNFDAIFGGSLEITTDETGNWIGQQYQTDIGPIDILAEDTATGDLVVIELKKGRPADKVAGQVLRYMGWVKEKLCTDSQGVRGLIICREADKRLDYALQMVNNIDVKYYRVDFHLQDSPVSG